MDDNPKKIKLCVSDEEEVDCKAKGKAKEKKALPDGFYNAKNPLPPSMFAQYTKEWGLARCSIESINFFYINDIPSIFNNIVFNVPNRGKLVLSNTRVTKPNTNIYDGINSPLYPAEALLRNLHYKGIIIVDVTFIPSPNIKQEFNIFEAGTKSVPLMSIPIMTHSVLCNLSDLSESDQIKHKACPYDVKGFFITSGQDKGGEKALLPQERMGGNIILCFKKKEDYSVEMRCSAFNTKPKKVALLYIDKGLANSTFTMMLDAKYQFNIVVLLRLFNFKHIDMIDEILFRYMIRNKSYTVEQIDTIKTTLNNIIRPQLQFEKDLVTDKKLNDYICKAMDMEGHIDENLRTTVVNRLDNDIFIQISHSNQDKKMEMKCHLMLLMWSKLCEMIIKMPDISGVMKPLRESDDRDNYTNKRIDMPGTLMSVIMHQFSNRFITDLQTLITKDESNIHPIEKFIKNKVKPIEKFTKSMDHCMSTGIWGEKGNQQNKVGVTQPLSRQSLIGAYAHTRRINTAVDKTGKNTFPRYVHSRQWGFVDPLETPEGQACGLVKNPTLLLYTSLYSEPFIIMEYIKEYILPLDSILDDKYLQYMPFICNGTTYGWCDGWFLSKYIKTLRRKGLINFSISISISKDYEFIIHTEAGRCMRPLYVIDEETGRLEMEKYGYRMDFNTGVISHPNLSQKQNPEELVDIFKKFERLNCIEYLDGYEIDSIIGPPDKVNIIATVPQQLLNDPDTAQLQLPTVRDCKFSYLEIDANCIFGMCVALIPFSDSNQSPRNAYWAAMGKQAITIISTFFKYFRFDTNAKMLCTPQKSLVTTDTYRAMKLDEIPYTINPIVLINTSEGYNIEDSITLSQSSVDFGLGRTVNYHSITVQENPSIHKTFGVPDLLPDEPKNKYAHLDKNGFPNLGTTMECGQVLVGMIQTLNSGVRTDDSYYLRGKDCGIVDEVCITTGPNNITYCKVRLRETRIPQVGDKFASLHAQKGTIGRIVPRADLPFDEDGISPDLIINPHAFPSRMTIGMLKEMIVFLVCVLMGCSADATSFKNRYMFDKNTFSVEKQDGKQDDNNIIMDDINAESNAESNAEGANKDDNNKYVSKRTNICEILKKLKLQPEGNCRMYSGITGELFQCPMFMAPCGYSILKHFVDDKIHSRARGPRQSVNRQPLEGRSRNGGLRLGEMERDNFISYGSASLLRERFMTVSDNYEMDICENCGFPVITNHNTNIYRCNVCNVSAPLTINIPYSSKLLLTELNSMGISTKFITQ